MHKPRILVTRATGKTGSAVATELLQGGHPVRVLVRRDDIRSARLRALGAEVVVAEMADVERVADALKDVQRAYFCPPFDPVIGVAAHLGVLPWIYGDSRNAPPSSEDVARVALAALRRPELHAGEAYHPTGPALLGAEEMARAIARAVGRPVRVARTPLKMFMKAMRADALSLAAAVRIGIRSLASGAWHWRNRQCRHDKPQAARMIHDTSPFSNL